MKKAFITGITGQDGSYLAELLLSKGYEVHGLIRRSSSFNTGRLMGIFKEVQDPSTRIFLHYGDLTDGSTLARYIRQIQPDEIYNLGAQSHVRVSFDMPEYTADVVGMGCVRLLEAIREANVKCKFYQASSSEMFGSSPPPQTENTAFQPVSPYGIAKLFAHHHTMQYRESYSMYAVSGILFNHESPRRGETFVTRKITRGVARILAGKMETLYMGNLDATRDWGYAPDYVQAIWLMMQQDVPKDFLIATGEMHSVKEFLEKAFQLVGRHWENFVKIDPRYFRPREVDQLRGDPSRARTALGWKPKVGFEELVRIMVKADLEADGLDPKKFMKD